MARAACELRTRMAYVGGGENNDNRRQNSSFALVK